VKGDIFFGLFFNPEDVVLYSAETSVDFQQAIWFYIPEYSTFHNRSSENLKS
jgi:hypothetical protein